MWGFATCCRKRRSRDLTGFQNLSGLTFNLTLKTTQTIREFRRQWHL